MYVYLHTYTYTYIYIYIIIYIYIYIYCLFQPVPNNPPARQAPPAGEPAERPPHGAGGHRGR